MGERGCFVLGLTDLGWARVEELPEMDMEDTEREEPLISILGVVVDGGGSNG